MIAAYRTADRPGTPRPGFTLVELVVSISVLSIIMSALMSTILLASHALPTLDDPAIASAQVNDAFEAITADAMVASTIATDGAVLKLTVPDRTGDSVEETVTYGLADGASPPTPLQAIVNNGTPRTLYDRAEAIRFSIVSFDDRSRLLIVEIATPTGCVHRAAVDLLTRPGISP